jgi:hypothetical protein
MIEERMRAARRIHTADRVVIDDVEARRCAKAMGLAINGTLGIGPSEMRAVVSATGGASDALLSSSATALLADVSSWRNIGFADKLADFTAF